jgi:pilus assembly protein Flp/PilA
MMIDRDARGIRAFRRPVAAFFEDQSGPTAVEYAVLLALILMAAIAMIGLLGGGVEGRWKLNADRIMDAMKDARG